jgi:hypothetical protein
LNTLIALRNITHLIYDTTYTITNYTNKLNAIELNVIEPNAIERKSIITRLDKLISECDYLAARYENTPIEATDQYIIEKEEISYHDNRFTSNINGMEEMFRLIRNLS